MITEAEFRALAAQGHNRIPLVEEVFADLDTPLSYLDYVLDKLDLVLVMSVNPGFGGQSFIAHALEKLRASRKLVDMAMQRTGRTIHLEVDGGVKADNIRAIAEAGADTFVAGSAIFASPDYRGTMAHMREELAKVAVV